MNFIIEYQIIMKSYCAEIPKHSLNKNVNPHETTHFTTAERGQVRTVRINRHTF